MAQDWATRDGDVPMTPAEMQAEEVGRQLTFFDNGVSAYGPEGTYSHTYDGGDTALGVYTLGEDGVVCTVFRNGFDRCDKIVHNGAKLVVITKKVDRFPVRESRSN